MLMFAVAYTNFFDNMLIQQIIFAESEVEAMKKMLNNNGWDINDNDFVDIENLKRTMFNSDVLISAIEVIIT